MMMKFIWNKALDFWWIFLLSPVLLGIVLYYLPFDSEFLLLISVLGLFYFGVILGFIKAKKSGYTLWSCFALLLAMLYPILGIICSIVALYRTRKNEDLKGSGLAKTALAIAIILILMKPMYQPVEIPMLPVYQPGEIYTYSHSEYYQMEQKCETYCMEEMPDYSGSIVEINPKNNSDYDCICYGKDTSKNFSNIPN